MKSGSFCVNFGEIIRAPECVVSEIIYKLIAGHVNF